MNTERQNTLYELLSDLYEHKKKTCDINCCECDYGMIVDYSGCFNCAIKHVMDTIIEESFE